MDICDQAEKQEAMQREASIAHARASTGPRLQHTGECHYCAAEVASPKLFCNGFCATRYDKTKR